MRLHRIALASALAASPWAASAQSAGAPSAGQLGTITIRGGPAGPIAGSGPATVESIGREQIQQSINAADSEDALKYFPSLLVRKRYIGDYNHAILSSRASGTGNSARSLVYADGILLSNLLGNGVGGLAFPPRWGLVTPEEIKRVDVLYGPYAAAYPGNSLGAVVHYTTRMPSQLEGHVKLGYVHQPFELYGTDSTFRSWQSSASLGSRAGDWAWWLHAQRTDSESQPLTFASRLQSAASPTPGQPVTGAVADRNPQGVPIYYVAAGTQYHTVQDHLKAKLAYDFGGSVQAAYTFGAWHNTSTNLPQSYLRNGAGDPVSSGPIQIGGVNYAALTGADLPVTRESLTHTMHGFTLQSRTQGRWDGALAVSRYGYKKDDKRQNAVANTPPLALSGGPGTLAQGAGSGWTTLDARATWRPEGPKGEHIVEFGLQQDLFELQYLTHSVAGNYLADGPGPLASEASGRTRLRSLWVQDSWRFAPEWEAVLGARAEQWNASRGTTRIPGATPPLDVAWPGRQESEISPKLALSWQWRPKTQVKLAVGRAFRFPTVAELYGATATANAQFINDPNLRPEKSWSGELGVQHDLGDALLRLTAFAEDTRDALYTQTVFDPAANRNISRVQNVGRVATHGLEAAYNGYDVFRKGLDISGSITWTHSVIRSNEGFVTVPGDTIGRRQPNVPEWRASAVAAYRWNAQWVTSVGARYSGRQFRTLDNSDINGNTYQGVSSFFVVDLRAHWQFHRNMSAAIGIDNANNDKYWNFHPYPQRSYVMELKADF